MVYIPTIPNPGDTLAGSQPQIRGNFSEINTDFARNHVALTDATVANRGKHNVVEFNIQAADPVLIATEGELYTKSVAATPQMFWKRFGGTAVQMTATDPAITVVPGIIKGRTFLPGGLLLQYGNQVIVHGVVTTITYQTDFSAPPYSLQLTIEGSVAPASEHVIRPVDGETTFHQFKAIYTGNNNYTMYWVAIGPA